MISRTHTVTFILLCSIYRISHGFSATGMLKVKPALKTTGHYQAISTNVSPVTYGFKPVHQRTTSTAIQVASLRGGAVAAATTSGNPLKFFNNSLLGLFLATAFVKAIARSSASSSDADDAKVTKSKEVKSLQFKFLSVFWVLRCADWLQGPYFYEVYASKVFNGVPASLSLISRLFLTGFVATAAFGPIVGSIADRSGRKKGTLAFTVLYAIGALSTKSPILGILLLGRVASGIGTSLLFSAPESWLVGESQRLGVQDSLGETFGLAYAVSYYLCCMFAYLYAKRNVFGVKRLLCDVNTWHQYHLIH